MSTSRLLTPCLRPRGAALALLCPLVIGCYSGHADGPRHDSPLEDGLPLAAAPDASAFPNIVTLPLGLSFTPLGLQVGDFDGDGALDLLVTGSDMGGVDSAVLLGNGDGTFAPPFDPNLGGCSAFPVVGELNEDDRTDVLTPGCSNDLVVYAGRINGAFSLWPHGPEDDYPNLANLVVADFEGDGDRDIFVLSHLFNEFGISVELGAEGRGFWQRIPTVLDDVDEFLPSQLAVAHLDDDGILDVVVAEREQDVVRLFGERTGQFVLPLALGVDVPPWSLDAGDMTGDGLDEVVVASYSDPSLQVLSPDGSGGLSFGAPFPLVAFAPYDTVLADLDADGDLDVAMVDDTQASVQWIAGDGLGGLGAVQSFALPSPAIRVHAGDFDGDGVGDLVTATFADGSVTLLMSTPP